MTMLNSALFIAEAFLAVVFTLVGGVKLLVPRETLQKKMHWAPSWPRWRIKLLGLAEVLGATALVVPGATGVAPVLTPVAAVCLAILMAGAIATHRRLGERFLPAVIVGALCLFVGLGHPSLVESLHRVTSPRSHPTQGTAR
ncbi:MAG TPA: DoxX family protein [Myxococcaceae bacterium]|nr:DoxX family protein [Myxococcaceae bacterium]